MTDIAELRKIAEQLKESVEKDLNRLKLLEEDMAVSQKEAETLVDSLDKKIGKVADADKLVMFFKHPYVVEKLKAGGAYIYVPKFVNGFQVGWLHRETESFYVYKFNQYSAWLGQAPEELLEVIEFKKDFEAVIEGDTVKFESKYRDSIKDALKGHVREWSDNSAFIIRGHEFDVIANMIESGCLPFKPQPVAENDLALKKTSLNLRPYQSQALKRFMETGAVGVFHPTGAGKSFVAMAAIEMLKGKKIIIMPTRTLIEQWEYYIETYIPQEKENIKLVTYQGCKVDDTEYVLAVFEECQRLPANTFSRLALLPAKYRLGLSASPFREDGRESYIFALTGFPVGLDWKEYMQSTGKKYHPVYVHTVPKVDSKIRKLESILDRKKKTIIFCDGIDMGRAISQRLDIPHIHGDTVNRIDEIKRSKVVVLSRVGDLGISIPGLQRIIEVDFLGGSRGQEIQRTGRLMHSEDAERHDIIFTEGELSQFGKRLWSLQEKGFTIKVEN